MTQTLNGHILAVTHIASCKNVLLYKNLIVIMF